MPIGMFAGKIGSQKDPYWMQHAVKRPGQFHRDLGIPEGQRIPLQIKQQAAADPYKFLQSHPTVAKRVAKEGGTPQQFAQRARLAMRFQEATHARMARVASQNVTRQRAYS